eukprot:scaffold919_cov96-Skeletonema_dohrnii-CCMP3373.AAC.3
MVTVQPEELGVLSLEGTSYLIPTYVAHSCESGRPQIGGRYCKDRLEWPDDGGFGGLRQLLS